MSNSRRWFVVAAAAAFLLLTGCATSRSEVRLSSPGAAVDTPSSDGKVVVIRSIRDDRIFEEAPKDPSTPSLGFGGAEAASAEIRARAIGRKRNGYGKALGDVLLENGQTIEAVIGENLTAALRQAGYRVQSSSGDADAVQLDVRIKRFWAWFQPGFWAITLNANISTELVVDGKATPISIDVDAQDKRQAATDKAWVEIVDQALQAFRAAATAKTRDQL